MRELATDIQDVLGAKLDGLLVNDDNIAFLHAYGDMIEGATSCVYIDPPYRNGDSYEHYEDGLGHSEWLEGMRNLLPLLFRTLNERGSLWISIDDAELAYLKVLCDELFGRESFQATIVWEHRKTRENRATFSHNHEYLLCYAKDPLRFKEARNTLPCKQLERKYSNPDDDPRGPWQSITATAPAGHAVASQYYDIVSPVTGKVNTPPHGRCWVYNEEKMAREIAEGRIYFGRDGNGAPRVKKYLADANLSLVPETLWLADEAGTTASAKKHILRFRIQTDAVFDTPKPEELLHRVIQIATQPGDLVLDAFMGSGTTPAACHKAGRRYIGVDSSESAFAFAAKRMGAVVQGEQGGISKAVGWKGGGRFGAFSG